MADLLALTPVWFCYFRSSVIGVFLLHQQVSGNIIAFLFIAFAVSWHAWCWNPIVLSFGWTIQQMFQENLSFFHTRCIPGFKTLKSQGGAVSPSLILGKPAHPWEHSSDKAAEGIHLQHRASSHQCIFFWASFPAILLSCSSSGKEVVQGIQGVSSTGNSLCCQ